MTTVFDAWTMQLTFEVVGNSLRGDRLGHRVDTSHDQPTQQDVGSLDIILFGNLFHDIVLTEVALAGTTKRRVTLGENVLGLEVGNKLGLRALDRKLHLVCLPQMLVESI